MKKEGACEGGGALSSSTRLRDLECLFRVIQGQGENDDIMHQVYI